MNSPKLIKPEEYINHLTGNETNLWKKQTIIENAYRAALDTRKFEIDLYWKRATYFWAFIAAIFIAVCSILKADYFKPEIENSGANIILKCLIVLLSFLGYLFSLGWLFVNRGSKVWQKNWEKHIDFLENEINGPLFKTVIKPNLQFWHLNSYFPYSVSKVNLSLSLFVTFFWIILFFGFLNAFFYQFFHCVCWSLFINLLAVLILIGISWVFHNQSLSFMYRDWKRNRSHKRTYIDID